MSGAKKTVDSKKETTEKIVAKQTGINPSSPTSSQASSQNQNVALKGVQSVQSDKHCESSSRRHIHQKTLSVPESTSSKVDQQDQLACRSSSPIAMSARSQEPSSELRSTLAIGQLIASNRPTAGSRLIANEIRLLSKTIQNEATMLKHEIADLAATLTSTLKSVFDDDSRASVSFGRVPYYGRGRGFPVFRRPRRIPLQFARKSVASTSTSTSPQAPPSTATAASTTSTTSTTPARSQPTATTTASIPDQLTGLSAKKIISSGSLRDLHQLVAKNLWLPQNRDSSSYEGEADTDSSDTSPNSTP